MDLGLRREDNNSRFRPNCLIDSNRYELCVGLGAFFLAAEDLVAFVPFFFELCFEVLCFLAVVGLVALVDGATAGASVVADGVVPAACALAATGTMLAARKPTKANTEISAFMRGLLGQNNGCVLVARWGARNGVGVAPAAALGHAAT
jgi:hypothetical protein